MKKTLIYVLILASLLILASCSKNEPKKEAGKALNDGATAVENEKQADEEEEHGAGSYSAPSIYLGSTPNHLYYPEAYFESAAAMIEAFDQVPDIKDDEFVFGYSDMDEKSKERAAIAMSASRIPAEGLLMPMYKGELFNFDETMWGNKEKKKVYLDGENQFGFTEIFYYPSFGVLSTELIPKEIGDKIGDGDIEKYSALKGFFDTPESIEEKGIIKKELNIGGEMIPVKIATNVGSRYVITFVYKNELGVRLLIFPQTLETGVLENLSFERVELPRYTGNVVQAARDFYE
jgi:hypothetical protein